MTWVGGVLHRRSGREHWTTKVPTEVFMVTAEIDDKKHYIAETGNGRMELRTWPSYFKTREVAEGYAEWFPDVETTIEPIVIEVARG